MGKVIACIDGSVWADSVCFLSAWAAEKSASEIALLHVVAPHGDVAAKGDLSGSIGLGAKSDLLKELTEMDEARGKLEQKKGQLMLAHAQEELGKKDIKSVDILHRRGSLVETISELEDQAELIVIGKRGEQAENAPDHLGSNLERVARAVTKPLLVATKDPSPVKRFLLAYDGSESAKTAVEYVMKSPLLKGLECHLVKVCEASGKAEEILNQAEEKLKSAGFNVKASLQQGKPVSTVVSDYIEKNDIDLLAIGAYGHSRVRSFILGSSTTNLIHKTNVPVLLFR